jgi:phosphatidylglycerol lysyltransferase
MENIKFRLPAITSNAKDLYGIWGVRLVSILVWLLGGVNLLSALQPTWLNRLQSIKTAIPLELQAGSPLTVALAGCALFLLAGNLWRHKRSAWLLTIFLLAFTTLIQIFKGPGFATGPSISLLLILLSLGYSFYARSDSPAVYRGLSILASAFIVPLAAGVVGFIMQGIHFHQPVGLSAAANQTMTMLASFYNPAPQLINSFSWYFSGSIYILGISAIGSALLLLNHPVVLRHRVTEGERRRVTEIVEKYGRSIIAPMALFDDKQYFFSQCGSVIAYGVRGRGALALGDPIGPAGDSAAAISDFKKYCARNDWQPSFIYVPCEGLSDYHTNGFDTLCIAYEARVPLASFTMEGHGMRGVRAEYNKIARLGYQARFYAPPLKDEILHELHAVSDEWLSTHYGGEKYFLVGSFNEDYIRNSPIIAVHAPDGQMVAFANLVIANHISVITGDLVRSRTNIANGMLEFLIVSMMNWAMSQGYNTFSLSAVTAVGKGTEQGEPPIAKVISTISVPINRLYKFKGIYHFKNKFHPDWEPHYLAYPGTTALIPALLTMLQLYSTRKSA